MISPPSALAGVFLFVVVGRDTYNSKKRDERGGRMGLRFVADAMLGRLARWLRILGYDTLYNAAWDDPYLVRLARAEGRVLLTRDTGLARRRGVRVLLVEGEMLDEQIAHLRRVLGIAARAAYSRCPVCNGELRPVSKEIMRGRVPPYVFATQQVFRVCPDCGRAYWRGTHWERMREVLAGWEKDNDPPSRDPA